MNTKPAPGLTLAALAGALLLASGSAQAAPNCIKVNGHYSEHAADPSGCNSPIELCIVVQYSGGVRGPAYGVATALIETADTATTGVLAFTSTSEIVAEVQNYRGTLYIRNAGVFHAGGRGEIVDLQTIVGGSGDFAGATGALNASGTFTFADGGQSEYSGTVCLP